MALTAQRTAMEAARGALLAVHAAAGLSAGANLSEATRICRAAEGLLRTAVAALSAPPRTPAAAAQAVAPPETAPRRRRRPRARRARRDADAMDDDAPLAATDVMEAGDGTGGEKRGRDATLLPKRRRAAAASPAAAAGAPSSSGDGLPKPGDQGMLAWLPPKAGYSVQRVVRLKKYDPVTNEWEVVPYAGFKDDEMDLSFTGVPVAHMYLLPDQSGKALGGPDADAAVLLRARVEAAPRIVSAT